MVVYVDVDETLIRSAGGNRFPIAEVVAHVRKLKEEGVTLYCWSSSGSDYARRSAIEVGLEHSFEAFLPKPRVIIDDQTVDQWPFCITVHPSWCAGKSLADYSDPKIHTRGAHE